MPAWLISLLLNFVLKFGIPWILDWLRKRFPNLLPTAGPILTQYVKDVEEAKMSKKEARKRAHDRLKECSGLGCPPDLKRE